MCRGRVDGALLLWPGHEDEPLVHRLHQSGFRLVLIEPEAELPGVAAVFPDAFGDGYRSTHYLLGLGHRRIADCTEGPRWGIANGHIAGYHAAMTDSGLAVDPALDLPAE